MTNLVLLATVFITLNGFARSYPSRTLNQPTNRLEPAAFTLPTRIDNQKWENLPVEPRIVDNKVVWVYVLQTKPTHKSDEVEIENDDKTSKSRNKKNTWKSNIDQLNKWRLPRMENNNLPMVFILRTNEYEK